MKIEIELDDITVDKAEEIIRFLNNTINKSEFIMDYDFIKLNLEIDKNGFVK